MNVERIMDGIDLTSYAAAIANRYHGRPARLRGFAAGLRELAKHATPAGHFELNAWADQIDATLTAQEPR